MKQTHIMRYSILLALGLASVATVNTANNAQAKNYSYRVVTVTKSPYATVHDSTGKEVYGRGLALNSDWRSDKTITVNGTLYYQVSTDEWIRSEDVEANWDPATGKLKQENSQQQQKLVGKINSTVVDIYYNNGSTIGRDSGRFQFGSAWKIGKVLKNAQGKYFYQVSNNEYISSDDMEVNGQPQNVVYYPAFGYGAKKPSDPITSDPISHGTVPIAQHESAAAYQQAVVNVINSKRANRGLPPLRINPKLTQAATIRTTEEYNDPMMNENTSGPRPDRSNWWSVLGEVDYDWSYARELNFLLSDSYDDLTQLNTPSKVTEALMLLYAGVEDDNGVKWEEDYLSPEAKEIGVSIRYSDKAGLTDKIYTVIEIGAPR